MTTRVESDALFACIRGHRGEYAATLDDVHADHSEDPFKLLQGIMFPPWSHAYRELCAHEASVHAFDYRDAVFAFDQWRASDELAEGRVVAVLARSVRWLGWRELMELLRDRRDDAAVRESTVERVSNLISDSRDGASRARASAIRNAVCDCVVADGTTLSSVVARVVDRQTGCFARTRVLEDLWTLEGLLRGACSTKCGSPARPMIPADQRIVREDLHWLQLLAGHAEQAHAGGAAVLQEVLRSGHFDSIRFFEDRLKASVSDAMLGAMERHLSPLLDRRGPRDRDLPFHHHMALPKAVRDENTPRDLGHFVPHAAGGPSNINLYWQDRRLNRGWSEEGRRFRAMEAFTSKHPGTLYFVRLLYEDDSAVPKLLEVGVLLPAEMASSVESGEIIFGRVNAETPASFVWWIDVFDNRPPRESNSGSEQQPRRARRARPLGGS